MSLLTACAGPPPLPAGLTPTGRTSALTSNYSLPIHCGVRFATFDGANWEVDPPAPKIPTSVTDSASGGGHNRYSISGRMVRLSEDAAVFTTTDDPVGVIVRFHRSATPAPGCA